MPRTSAARERLSRERQPPSPLLASRDMSFGDRLAAQVAARESQIVLGLDPDPQRLWPEALEAAAGVARPSIPAERAAAAVAAHCIALIDAAGPACVACKPQLACFERLGAPGWDALASTVRHARDAGLLVLLDGKRGDIDVSAAAYAQALFGATPTPFGDVPGLQGDAATINPLLGADALLPLVEGARAHDAGVFVLVRTSNPGARDVQDLRTDGGQTVYERLAALTDSLGARGPRSGIGDVGAVVGATAPEHVVRLRELMPGAPFLLPGVGAQGGRVEDLRAAFVPGPAGGLVTASRSIARAHEHDGAPPAVAARAEAERLRAIAWSLA
jgi:orotidine-5'-phosphate decarboxylase